MMNTAISTPWMCGVGSGSSPKKATMCKDCGANLGPGDKRRKRCAPCQELYWNKPKTCRECNEPRRSGNELCSVCQLFHSQASRYGLTARQLKAMYDKQGNRCAICDRDQGKRKLSVDHDHSCCSGQTSCGKCVRALICNPCNVALGMMRDDASTLRRAADYLETFSSHYTQE